MKALSDLIRKKKIDFEKAKSRDISVGGTKTFNMKLRVRMGIKLATGDRQIAFKFRGRTVKLLSRTIGKPLNDSEWVVFKAGRFPSIEKAVEFGLDLQTTLALVAVQKGIPIDVGADNIASSSFSEHIKAAFASTGGMLLDDVHGVDVYPHGFNAAPLSIQIVAETSLPPKMVDELLGSLTSHTAVVDEKGRRALLLLNAVGFAHHPAAVITLCISAVEMLAADEMWTTSQRAWIDTVPGFLDGSPNLTVDERSELLRAVQNLKNFGISEKCRRLLRNLDMGDEIKRWNTLYKGRSEFVHGLKYVSNSRMQQIATEASALTKQIVHRYIATSSENSAF